MGNKKNPLVEFGKLGESWWKSISREGSKNPVPLTSIRKTLGQSHLDWIYIKELLDEETIIECEVIAINQGGLLVSNDSVTGFVPISHINDFPHSTKTKNKKSILIKYVGKDLRLKIIECEKSRGRIVLSERAALSEPGVRNKLINTLNIGEIVKGKVTNITDFGVFVDLGGLEGLIHISELSWGRVSKPSSIIQINEELEVVIINIQKNEGKISLSLKQLNSNPWDSIDKFFPIGSIVQGSITKIVVYGAFVSLSDGFEGLIHASEMALTEGLTPKDVVKIGQIVDVEVVRIDPNRKRMSFRLIG